MSRGREHRTGLIITGDASGGIRAMRATDSELGKLNKGFDRGSRRSKQFTQNINGTSRELAVLRRAAAPIAGVIAGMFAANTLKSQIDWGDQLQKTNLRIGASTEALSQYNYVAKLSGVEFGQLTNAWRSGARRISEAADGTGSAVRALDDLGLSAKELNRLAPEDQFERIAAAMQSVEGAGDRAALAQRIWGREGVVLTQIVSQGTDAIASMRAEADALGLTISQETANAMATYNDEVDRLKFAAQGVSQVLMAELVPSMTAGLQSANEMIQALGGAEVVVGHLTDGATVLAALLAGRYAGAFLTATGAKLAATQQSIAYQMALARMAGVSTTVVASQAALAASVRGVAGALTLVGGPAGAAVIAVGALFYFREELGFVDAAAKNAKNALDDNSDAIRDGTAAALDATYDNLINSLEAVSLQAQEAMAQLTELEARQAFYENSHKGMADSVAGAVDQQTQALAGLWERQVQLQTAIRKNREAREQATTADREGARALEDIVVTADAASASTETAAAASREAAKQTTTLANSYENLLDRIQPNRRAARQYAQDVGVLNLALATGRMTTVQYMQAMGMLQESFQAAQRDTENLARASEDAGQSIARSFDTWGTVADNTLRRVDDAGKDTWLGMVDGSRSALDTVKRGFQQTLAEIMHMLTTQRLTFHVAGMMGLDTTGMPGGGGMGGMNLNSLGSLGNTVGGWFGGGGAAAGAAPVGYASGFGAQAATGTYTGWAGSAAASAANPGMFASMGGWSGIAGGLGAGYAGMQVGNMIAPDAKFGTAAGGLGALGGFALGGPLGAAIGGAIAPAISKGLFGGSWQTKDGGLNLGVSGGDITGNQYEHQRKSGGLFSGSSYRTKTSALDGSFEGALSEAYNAQEASLALTLDVLGQQSSALNSFSTGLTKISTKGKSEAEVEQAVQNWLQNVVNRAARSVVNPAEFALAGETTVETLNRLATALTGVNPILEQLHGNAFAASLAGGDAAASLVALSGGMEQFAQRADYYYANFYSEAERQEAAMTQAAKAIVAFTARTGEIVTTTDDLRALVDGIDRNSVAGRELYAAAMQLAPALVEVENGLERVRDRFADMLSEAESAFDSAEQKARSAWQAFSNQSFGQQITLLESLGESQAALNLQRARELLGIDPLLHETQRFIWAMEDEAEAKQRVTQAAQNYRQEIERVRGELSNTLGGISQWIDQRNATAQAPGLNLEAAGEQFARQLVLAESGDRNALQSITQYADQYLTAGEAMFASGGAFQSIQQQVLGALKDLPEQISSEEYLAQEIRDALQDVVITAMPTDERLATLLGHEMQRLDANQLTSAQVRAALSPIATDAEINKLLRRVDANGDGIITEQELANQRLSGLAGGIGSTLAPMFDSIDLDASGLIDWNEFYGAFAGLASDSELRRIFNKLDADGSGQISRLEAISRSSDGTDDNTKTLEERARDQLTELNGLVSEMSRTTDQFIGLNSGISSLTQSINALGVANAEIVRIEKERAAAEKAERERVSRERQAAQEAAKIEQQASGIVSRAGGAKSKIAEFENNLNNQEWNQFVNPAKVEEYMGRSWVTEDKAAFDKRVSGFQRDNMFSAYAARYTSFIQEREAALAGMRKDYRELTGNAAPFAKGGVFTNSIVSSPTHFDMGLMGEAGPEAIVPLHMGSDGLGIKNYAPEMPLPQFPLLNHTDQSQIMRDLLNENKQLRKELSARLDKIEKHGAAAVAVQQAGFNGQISEQKKGNAALEDMSAAARLEASR